MKSASSKERFRSPNIIFDSDDSEDSAEEESLYPGEYLKANTSVSTKLISPLQFRNQPISKSKSDSSAEDASSAQMHNRMLKSPAPKSAGKKSVKNIVSSGDEDETGKSCTNDEKSYFSPERSHNQLPYEKEEDITKNVGALSISTDRRVSLQSRNYPTQPSIANQTQPLATVIDASGIARQPSAQFDKHTLSLQLESTKRKKQELTKSLQYAKHLPDGGAKIRNKLAECEEEIIRLTEEVAAAPAPDMTNSAWAGDRGSSMVEE